MLASEMAPFCKTGGLADVVGSLPQALAKCGVDARVLLPHYSGLDFAGRSLVSLGEVAVPFDGGIVRAEIQQLVAPISSANDVAVYLLECPRFFRRAQLYGERDDILRFGFFCAAASELVRKPNALGWTPDIVHCHDWHAGLFAAYLRNRDAPIKTVFSIHNLAYQGLAKAEYLPRLGLENNLFSPQGLEFYGRINPLKAGLVWCDAITTVSQTYAREITTRARGEGLDGVLRERENVLSGIVNGLDYDLWNPATDPLLPAPYSASDAAGKKECKAALLGRCGLSASRLNRPVIGLVSRLSSQKGLDLVLQAMPQIVASGATFVLLGSGDARYLPLLRKLGDRFPDAVSMNIGVFDEPLAHLIYGGADMFLMPSQYEPCGLGQMIALAYGTVPIVRATGGLKDTVANWDGAQGDGFVFQEFSSGAMLAAIRRACNAFDSEEWPRIVTNTLAARWPWETSARDYAQLYESLMEGGTVEFDRTP